jgi:hypothetical protein
MPLGTVYQLSAPHARFHRDFVLRGHLEAPIRVLACFLPEGRDNIFAFAASDVNGYFGPFIQLLRFVRE